MNQSHYQRHMKAPDSKDRESDYEVPTPTLVYRVGTTIYFFDEVDGASVCEAIKFIDAIEKEKKIEHLTLVLNSGGGNIYDGLALYDRLRACKLPVTTIGTGLVASMAFIIFLAGDKRICSPRVRFLNHQAKMSVEGRVEDINIEQAEIKMVEDMCIDIIAGRTTLTAKKQKKDTKLGDKYIGAEEALRTQIVHEIIEEVTKEQGI
jgi:ATP-dependent Clp protease protease subunit